MTTIAVALTDRYADWEVALLMAEGRSFLTQKNNTVEAFATRAFDRVFPGDTTWNEVHFLGVEQSNSSVVLNNQALIKLYRRLEDGDNPDLEISRHLTEHTGFTALAPVAGGMRLERDGRVATLAMLQPYLENDGDGWQFALRSAAQFAERSRDLDPARRAPFAGLDLLAAVAAWPTSEPPAWCADDLAAFATLGTRTAELHLALAEGRRFPAFRPEPLDRNYLVNLADGCRERGREALERLNSCHLSAPVRQQLDQVLAQGDRCNALFLELAALRPETSGASDMAEAVYRRTSDIAGSVGETLSHTGDKARRMLHDRRDAFHMGRAAARYGIHGRSCRRRRGEGSYSSTNPPPGCDAGSLFCKRGRCDAEHGGHPAGD